MNVTTLVILVVLVIVYIDLGGMVFYFLEHENDKEWYTKSRAFHTGFLKSHDCVSEAQMTTYFHTILNSYKHGVLPWNKRANLTSWKWNMWDYASGVFYSMTIVSTIGFANMLPTNDWSKVFLVAFSFFGIPLFFAMANASGKRLYKTCFRCCLPKKSRICSIGRLLVILLVMVIGVGIFVVLPSVMFYFVEDWPFIDSLFHSYLMVSTLGSADNQIGTNPVMLYHWWYKVVCSVWLFFAFIWLFVMVHSWLELFKDINKKFSGDAHHLKNVYGKVPPTHSKPKDWRYSDQTTAPQRHYSEDSSYEYDQNQNRNKKASKERKKDKKRTAPIENQTQNHVQQNHVQNGPVYNRDIIEVDQERSYSPEQNHIGFTADTRDTRVRKSKRRSRQAANAPRRADYHDNDRFDYDNELRRSSRYPRARREDRRGRYSSEESRERNSYENRRYRRP